MSTVQTLWDESPRTYESTDYLGQVGMTVKGKPISGSQFQLVVDEISHLLRLEKGDALLDLCCGNGLITSAAAKRCGQALGLDFSSTLLAIARKAHSRPNVVYQFMSVLDAQAMQALGKRRFNKILMYTSLQFFSRQQFELLLQNLMPLVSDEFIMLIGNIPDRAKWNEFYDTPLKRAQCMVRRLIGKEHLAVWWGQEALIQVCESFGLRCVIHEQDARMYNAHFRFDAVIKRL